MKILALPCSTRRETDQFSESRKGGQQAKFNMSEILISPCYLIQLYSFWIATGLRDTAGCGREGSWELYFLVLYLFIKVLH